MEIRGYILVFAVLLSAITFRMFHDTSTVYEYKDVRVNAVADNGYRLLLAHVDGSPMDQEGHPALWKTICRDYAAPGFVVGSRLSKIILIDEENCQSLNPNKHAGYFTIGDTNGADVVQ